MGVVRYFVEYPDGRRLAVSMADAHQYGESWAKEDGVKLITRLERCVYPVVGTLEKALPHPIIPIPHENFGPSLLRPPVKVKP